MNLRIIRTSLSLLGVLGIGVTSWISVKCSKKADEETTTKGKIKAYRPAIASGVVTAACVFGANGVANKEIAALTAGMAYIAKSKDVKLLPKAEGKQENHDICPWEGPNVEWTGNGNTLCFEDYSGRMFYSSKEAVEKAISELNDHYHNQGGISLNAFYALLKIRKTTFGAEMGWKADPDSPEQEDIVILTIDDHGAHGEDMLIIDIKTSPEDYWEDE